MGHWREFEYVVVNDAFEQALAELQAIVAGRGEASGSGRAELEGLAAALTGGKAP